MSSELFHFFFHEIKTIKSPFILLKNLEKQFFSLTEKYINIPQKKYPDVIIGFSLMLHTSTIVPLQEIFESFVRSQNHSKETLLQLEEKLFAFVKKYNSWLLQFSVKNWFLRNPNGEINIITDTGKYFYSHCQEKTIDTKQTL